MQNLSLTMNEETVKAMIQQAIAPLLTSIEALQAQNKELKTAFEKMLPNKQPSSKNIGPTNLNKKVQPSSAEIKAAVEKKNDFSKKVDTKTVNPASQKISEVKNISAKKQKPEEKKQQIINQKKEQNSNKKIQTEEKKELKPQHNAKPTTAASGRTNIENKRQGNISSVHQDPKNIPQTHKKGGKSRIHTETKSTKNLEEDIQKIENPYVDENNDIQEKIQETKKHEQQPVEAKVTKIDKNEPVKLQKSAKQGPKKPSNLASPKLDKSKLAEQSKKSSQRLTNTKKVTPPPVDSNKAKKPAEQKVNKSKIHSKIEPVQKEQTKNEKVIKSDAEKQQQLATKIQKQEQPIQQFSKNCPIQIPANEQVVQVENQVKDVD